MDMVINSQDKKSQFFTRALMDWHEVDNDRSLPWKNTDDAYKIWLSEILLQQTRTAQGIPYYEKFIQHYPTIVDLAAAPDAEVFKLWEGLGYYNRCKNMLHTARAISANNAGVFPNTYDEIANLKGVGAYTAAAIASFAFQLPYAVVDGNVYRVLSRYHGIDTPIDSTLGKKQFQALAQDLLDKKHPHLYNQAIMDLGATVCTPKLAKCDQCPLSAKCAALKQDMIPLLPVKQKKLVIKERHFHYLVLRYKDGIYIKERVNKDIWQHLNEFYLVETADGNPINIEEQLKISDYDYLLESIETEKQKLTHQTIYSYFYSVELKKLPAIISENDFIYIKNIKNIPFPKTIVSFLNRMPYF